MYDTINTTDCEPLAGTQPLDDKVSVGTQSVPTIKYDVGLQVSSVVIHKGK